MTSITCAQSGKTVDVKLTAKGNPKLPVGWKWRGNKAYAPEAWNSLYCLRAITVPVVSPVVDNADPKSLREAWTVLNQQLWDAWQKSTEAANWAVKRLWSNDVTRQQSDGKCPKMKAIYLYGDRDWTGWSQSAGAVLRTVESSYRKKRYDIVWLGSAGIPNVRYPYPYPIHNSAWGLIQEKGGQIVFDCRLPSGRVGMRLKTTDKGGKYRLDALRHLIANPELRAESALIKKPDGTVMVKMVGWFPKSVRQKSGELWVRTGATVLLTLFNDRDEQQLTINGDWIRKKVAGHEAGRQRWSEDMKLETRIPTKRRRKKTEDMQTACEKMHSRLKSFIDETCAHIVGHAVRRGLSVIRYDDTERGYFPSFPWFKLKERLNAVCNRDGLIFESFGAEETTVTSRNPVKTLT
jgi:hypothetical protein